MQSFYSLNKSPIEVITQFVSFRRVDNVVVRTGPSLQTGRLIGNRNLMNSVGYRSIRRCWCSHVGSSSISISDFSVLGCAQAAVGVHSHGDGACRTYYLPRVSCHVSHYVNQRFRQQTWPCAMSTTCRPSHQSFPACLRAITCLFVARPISRSVVLVHYLADGSLKRFKAVSGKQESRP